MKKYLLMALTAMLLLEACSKQKNEKPEPCLPQIPAEETQQPANGTTATHNGIVHTQLNQELAYNKFVTIDVDNNGKNDLYFASVLIYDGQSHLYLLASPVSASGAKLLLNNDEELIMNGMWLRPLDANIEIKAETDAHAEWNNFFTKGVVLDVIDNSPQSSTFNGPWVAKGDKYLAMQVIIAGNIHYGWVRLSHTVNESRVLIKDFAYNTTPGASIKAGQTM